jgi:hypothetical protein
MVLLRVGAKYGTVMRREMGDVIDQVKLVRFESFKGVSMGVPKFTPQNTES